MAKKRAPRGIGVFNDNWVADLDDDDDDVERELDPEVRRARATLVRSVLRPYRHLIAIAVGFVVLSAAGYVALPILAGRAIDHGVVAKDLGSLGVTIALMAVAALADFVGQRLAIRLTGNLSEYIAYDLRTALWRHIQALSIDFFERQKTGRVVSRATSDIEAVYELFSQSALSIVSNVLQMAAITALLFWIDWVLALIVMGFVIPALWLSTWAFKVRSERAYRAVRERIALVIIHLAESLTGMRVVQAFGREPVNQAQFEDVNDQHRDANAETIFLMSVYGPGVDFLGQVATFLVLLFGGYRAIHHHITIGVVAAFLLYLRMFFDPVQELSQFYNSFQAAVAGLEKIAGVMLERSSVDQRATSRPLARQGGEIAFEGVRFAYRDTEVLHDLDLTIAPGETVALVGATGAGKSTIAKLIARFYDPTHGRLLLDGQDLRDVTIPSLRENIAIVPQEAFLFGGTIHDNIALGKAGASRASVEGAAAAVGAHPFISALPEGYDTDVNKRGARLSGGQRQLISFARAWLVDPQVLILDEATSALDLPSERLIQRALKTLLADRTAIVIAHRLTSIEIADRIAVVEAGRIVELGGYRELLAAGGRFAALHQVWESTVA